MDKEQNILDTILKGAAVTSIGIFFSKAMSYVYRAVVARMLGTEAYGNLSLGIMVVGIATTIGIFSLHEALKNYVPKYKERDDWRGIKGLVQSTFKIGLLASLFASLALFFGSDIIANRIFGEPELVNVIKIMALVPPFSIIGSLALDTTKGLKIAKYHAFTRQIMQPIVQLIGTVILVLLGFNIAGAAFGWFLGAFASAILGIYFMEYKAGPILRRDVDGRNQGEKALRYSFPLLMSGAVGSIVGWTDTAFLGYFLDSSAVGLYNAALPTALLLLIPYQALASLVLPSMSEVIERDDKELSSTLKTVARWTFMISFPMFCLMALFSEEVLFVLFGADFTSASTALAILSFGYLFSASVGHLDSVVKALDRTQLIFKNTLVNVVVNIALNILLIPTYGMIGAAIATTVSTIFAQGLLLIEVYYFKKTVPFSIKSLKPAFSAGIALISVYAALKMLFNTVPWWALFPGAIAYLVIYVAITYFLGLEETDKEMIEKAKEQLTSLAPVFSK